jgi:hypothetical protein
MDQICPGGATALTADVLPPVNILAYLDGKESKQAVDRRVTVEPMIQAQLIGQDAVGYQRMARTSHRRSRQLYRKLQIDHPEKPPKPN